MLIAISMIIYNQEQRSHGTEDLIWDVASRG
jgi:hypothetical protein